MISRFVAAVLMLWLLGFVWFGLFVPRPRTETIRTDGIVVLTGGPKRIARGLDILAEGSAQRMLISGVDRDVRPAELAVIYGHPRAFACCVDLGFQAVDTRSNAHETARWVRRHEIGSLRLVTGDTHMRRAELELELVLDGAFAVVPDAVPTEPTLTTLFLEYNKLWVRAFAGFLGI